MSFSFAAPDLSFRTIRLGGGFSFLIGRGRTFCSCIRMSVPDKKESSPFTVTTYLTIEAMRYPKNSFTITGKLEDRL